MAYFTGTSPAQVPTNADLGSVAYQDTNNVKLGGGAVSLSESVSRGYYQDTEVSDVLPTLMLDFGKTKALDPRISFTRASTATYYDGKTFAKTEENLLDWSSFQTCTLYNSSIIRDCAIAPDGTNTAFKIVEESSTVQAIYALNRYLVANDIITFSVYAKADTRSIMALRTYATGGDNYSYFNLSTGVLGLAGSTHTTSITDVGNGWFRCSVTQKIVTSGSCSFWICTSSSSNVSHSAEPGLGLFVWGAQLEKRAFAGPYAPTFGTPVSNTVPQLMTAAANVARFNHDPVTLESKGLLIEKQNTNLLTYSEDFRNTAMAGSTRDWVVTADMIIAPNVAIAPDGTFTANLVTVGPTVASITQAKAVTGTYVCLSFYAKKASGPTHFNNFVLRNNTSATNLLVIQVNYDTGVITYSTGTSGATMISVGGGWWRISLRAPFTTGNDCKVYIGSSIPTGQSAYLWGAQLEASAFPSSYIKTEAAQATRIADLATMSTTGWYRQEEGSIYSEADTMSDTTVSYNSVVYSLTDGNHYYNSHWLYAAGSTGLDATYTMVNNVISGALSVGFRNVPNVFYKVFQPYKINDFALIKNGVLIIVDTSGPLPVVNTLILGGAASPLLYNISGHIRKFAYYPKRLSNTECQQRTVIDG